MPAAGPLHDRVVLMTGARGAVGTVAREVFEAAGATLVRGGEPGSATEWKWFDVTNRTEAERAVKRAIETYGHIDVLVNLVGGWAPQPPVSEMPDEVLDRVLVLNFRSAFVMSRAVLPHMVQRKWGRLINVGAKGALKGSARNAAYAASKAAVITLTESIADEVAGTGVTANVILPSTVDTPENRSGMPGADSAKWVSPRALAETMAFLCTEAGGEINGARIPVFNRA